MQSYLREIAGRNSRVVRPGDFPAKNAATQLQRHAADGSLLRLAHGYYALVPEASRGPGTGWIPPIEAAALGLSVAHYGTDEVALIGPSAARMHGCYPRALAVAVVAVPGQRPLKNTVVGQIKFVPRDIAGMDVVRVDTELAAGWMTSVEQTLLDLSVNWPRWPVTETARLEMMELLGGRASAEILLEVAKENRGMAALERVSDFVR